uniref:Uncharacterized protein n=1 Tax=Vitis vinifera TaxID=29760 RepID=F6I1G1_VITVI
MGCRHLLEDIQKSFWAVRVELDDRKVIQEGGNREEERGEFSLRGEFGWRGLVGRRHSLVGCLRGRRAVRFLAHLAGKSYFELKEPGNSYDMVHSGNVSFRVDAVRVTKSISSPLKDPLIEVHLTYKSQAFPFENHVVANNRASGQISKKLNV